MSPSVLTDIAQQTLTRLHETPSSLRVHSTEVTGEMNRSNPRRLRRRCLDPPLLPLLPPPPHIATAGLLWPAKL
ncbi:hypothetical protein QFZ58_006562 [Streptomyces sp. B1I3]|nr:hypothetical protein [Streptomyces sp. B1I3]